MCIWSKYVETRQRLQHMRIIKIDLHYLVLLLMMKKLWQEQITVFINLLNKLEGAI